MSRLGIPSHGISAVRPLSPVRKHRTARERLHRAADALLAVCEELIANEAGETGAKPLTTICAMAAAAIAKAKA